MNSTISMFCNMLLFYPPTDSSENAVCLVMYLGILKQTCERTFSSFITSLPCFVFSMTKRYKYKVLFRLYRNFETEIIFRTIHCSMLQNTACF